ncbi:MAG: hypothetical protein RE472_08620 [Thermoplasmatales archaeon]|nr:MAG: hypothetical protein RE472_08620 [Thermoplasmatales archaeon]
MGHITKHSPSMLRFIMVTAAHIVIKYSDRMRKKYLTIVKTLGKNRVIIAISRIFIETIYTLLVNVKEFIDRIDALTERNMVSMRSRASKHHQIPIIEDLMNDLRMVQNDRRKRTGTEGKINKVGAIK